MQVLKRNKDFENYVLSLNKFEQLFDEGINIQGKSLEEVNGGYAPFTIDDKIKKGLPYDRITLFDTGKFYKSFKLILTSDYNLKIIANDLKEGIHLQDTWGKVIGLTDENYTKAVNRAREILTTYIQAQLIEFRKAA